LNIAIRIAFPRSDGQQLSNIVHQINNKHFQERPVILRLYQRDFVPIQSTLALNESRRNVNMIRQRFKKEGPFAVKAQPQIPDRNHVGAQLLPDALDVELEGVQLVWNRAVRFGSAQILVDEFCNDFDSLL
jgi:hypothetical protein